MRFSMAINLERPPPPLLKNACHDFLYNSRVCQLEISPRFRLNTALLVGILRVFLWLPLSKAFRKASLSLKKEQYSRLAKFAMSSRISSHLATRMKD